MNIFARQTTIAHTTGIKNEIEKRTSNTIDHDLFKKIASLSNTRDDLSSSLELNRKRYVETNEVLYGVQRKALWTKNCLSVSLIY